MKTYSANFGELQQWILVDASGAVLGQLASTLAYYLRGKHTSLYTPSVDLGLSFVVINTSQVIVTGRKELQKVYSHHTGYPKGLRQINFRDLQEKKPGEVIRLAVKGMLPKNKIGRAMLKRIHLYSDDQHPHAAQSPTPLKVLSCQ